MNESRKSRAEKMAESYANKLDGLQPEITLKIIHKLRDTATPEQNAKLKKAMAKLKTFWE
jgi:hypothetical protein